MKIITDENVHTDIVNGLRELNYQILTVKELGLAGHKDNEILEYSEKHNLVLISGDKDFGGLIEFGSLWGRGKVILLRYHILNINRIVKHIVDVLKCEEEILSLENSIVIVLSEAGYRIHRPNI